MTKHYGIGDLVMHKNNGRYGIIISEAHHLSGFLHGILVCKVTWLDFNGSNLIDINFLNKIQQTETT